MTQVVPKRRSTTETVTRSSRKTARPSAFRLSVKADVRLTQVGGDMVSANNHRVEMLVPSVIQGRFLQSTRRSRLYRNPSAPRAAQGRSITCALLLAQSAVVQFPFIPSHIDASVGGR